MSSVSAPRGLVPVYHPSGLIRPKCLPNGIASAQAGVIYSGQPVAITGASGIIAAIAANNVPIVGAFAGIEYTPSGGRPVVSPFYPGSVTFDTTMPVNVYYYDDPEIIYEIQADGPVTAATVGQEFNFTTGNLANGSTATGLSAATMAAATVGTGVQGQLTHVGFAPYVDNAYGDAFTVVQVKIARHQFRAVVVSI